MQIIPKSNLHRYIKHYLFIDNADHKTRQIRIFADGNTGVVFCTGGCKLYKNGEKLPDVFLYGQLQDFTTVETSGCLQLIIAVFKPYGLNGMFGIPAWEINNKTIDLELMSVPAVRNINDILFCKQSKHQIAEQLNIFFTHILMVRKHELSDVVLAANDFMLSRKGIFTAKELTEYTGYGQRNIERLFKNKVGISPKKLGGIIKLHYFLGEIRHANHHNTLTPLVYDAGYYDQAHLIRECRKITGFTPSAYHLKHFKLAVNVVDLLVENIQS